MISELINLLHKDLVKTNVSFTLNLQPDLNGS